MLVIKLVMWLTPGMPAHNVFKSTIRDRQLLKNMLYFSQFKHTGNLEVFHSLLLKYYPKRLQFSHHGMIGRAQLAILHFNAFINAEHAVTKDNVPRYKLQFSKVTQSHVVIPIKNVPENKFLNDLMSNILQSVKTGELHKLPEVPRFEDSVDKPTKEEIIRFHLDFQQPLQHKYQYLYLQIYLMVLFDCLVIFVLLLLYFLVCEYIILNGFWHNFVEAF